MNPQEQKTDLQQGRQLDELALDYTCFKAEQEIHATIAANYRRGVRRVTLRHIGGVLLLYLCLATLTGCAMAWYYPHTMTGTDRDTRMADYELTQQMVARK